MKYYSLSALVLSMAGVGFTLGVWLNGQIVQPAPLAGSAVQPIAGQTYNLAGSGISSSATSFTLTSFTITQTGQKIQDSDMSSTFYVTFEPGNKTRQEIASCTTVVQNSGGTATISVCTRGLSPISPYTASSSLQFAHGGGTAVLVDPDSPQLFAQFAAKDNDATVTGLWNFSTYLPTSSIAPTSATQLVNYATLLATAISGAGTSTETTMGISVLAPYSVVGLGTASTSSGAPYVLQNKDATTTPGTLCTGGTVKCIVAASLGKISQSWLDLTAAFTFSGGLTSSGSTNLASTSATTLNVNALNVAGSTLTATSTTRQFYLNTTISSISSTVASTTVFSVTVPAGTMSTSSIIHFRLPVASLNVTTGNSIYFEIAYGNATSAVEYTQASGGTYTSTGYMEFYLAGNGTTNSQKLFGQYNAVNGNGTAAAINATFSSTFATDSTAAQTFRMVVRPKASSGNDLFSGNYVVGTLIR